MINMYFDKSDGNSVGIVLFVNKSRSPSADCLTPADTISPGHSRYAVRDSIEKIKALIEKHKIINCIRDDQKEPMCPVRQAFQKRWIHLSDEGRAYLSF
jgi:hypothetical protein